MSRPEQVRALSRINDKLAAEGGGTWAAYMMIEIAEAYNLSAALEGEAVPVGMISRDGIKRMEEGFVASIVGPQLRDEHFNVPVYLSPSSNADRLEGVINLTPAEIQSGHNRVQWAEGLIRQLPDTHDGRNSWLMNYGDGPHDWPSPPPLTYAPRSKDYPGTSDSVQWAARPANFAGWRDQLLCIQSLLPDEDPANQEAVLSIIEEMLEGFDDVIETEAALTSPDKHEDDKRVGEAVICQDFIADPCGSAKCAGCGKRRKDHPRGLARAALVKPQGAGE